MVASFFFSEYACYLSPPFVLLALIGTFGYMRKSFPWVLGAIFFFFLYRGDIGPDSPTMLLRQLPLGGNIGLCGRWVIPLFFCLSVLAALGAEVLCERPREWGRRLAGILLVLGVADSWLVCAPNYRYLFQPAMPSPEASVTFRQYWSAFPVPLTSIAMAGMGSTNCGGVGYTVPRGAVLGYNEQGYRGDYYLLDAGNVTETLWTPNRLSYEVNANEPTSLVINQTMYPGWHLAHGDGLVYPENGLIAVRVPSGRQNIELVYTPHHIMAASRDRAVRGGDADSCLVDGNAIDWQEPHRAGVIVTNAAPRCAACDSSSYEPIFGGLLRCKDCGHAFAPPEATDEDLAATIRRELLTGDRISVSRPSDKDRSAIVPTANTISAPPVYLRGSSR